MAPSSSCEVERIMFGDLRRVGGGPGSWVGRRAIAIWAPFSIQATVFVRGMGYVCRSLAVASTSLRATDYTTLLLLHCHRVRLMTTETPTRAAATIMPFDGGFSFLCAEKRSRGEYSADMPTTCIL